MSDADKAYQAAKRLIAKAKISGTDELSFATPATHALEVLPPEIAALDKLRTLDLNDTQITDLTPLAGMVGMTRLYLHHTGVTDLTPLAGMGGMTVLTLNETKVTDLTPLAGMVGMTELSLSRCGVTDLTPLARMVGMTELWLGHTKVTDLTPLAGLVGVTLLWLGHTKVTDLTPLAGLVGMEGLYLDNTGVTDLTPLAGMLGMTGLSLTNTGVTDLTPLTGLLEMAALWLDDCAVSDLRPIRAMEKLVSEPFPGGLSFSGCAATKLDGRIAEIAKMKDASERAKALFAYLQDWLPPGEVAPEPDVTPPFFFLSYASRDRPQIAGLRDFLVGHGVPVWWDQDIPAGASWRSDIAEQLRAARAVITFWTAESVASKAVIEEASTAQAAGRLVHVRLDDAVLPYGFGETQYVDLRDWDGTATHPQMRKLLQALQDKLGPPDATKMAERLMAAAPIVMLPKDGRLVPVDTPPNIRPEVENAPDLAARLVGMKQNLDTLRTMAADRDNYQFPVDLGHALAGVHTALHAQTLSWYGISDARATLCDCMEDHDAKGSWNTTMFKGLDRLTVRMAELRPLLQPRQVPPGDPGAKPPEPEPVVRASDIVEVKKIALEVSAILASPEAAATLDPAVNDVVIREIERIKDAALSADETRKFANLRKGVRNIAYVTGGIIVAVTSGVAVNWLTAPEAAATLAKQLRPIFERLLQMFLSGNS